MDSITLRLSDGRRVRWGSAEHSADKVSVLAVLLRLPARVYDVSVPAQPSTVK
jgi:cell division protein FtsQ